MGTLILFTAALLVAGLTAGFLYQLGLRLQSRAIDSSEDSQREVSTLLSLVSVVGRRDAGGDVGLKDLDLFLQLAPHSEALALDQVLVHIKNGTSQKVLSYVNGAAGANQFNATELRDPDGSYTGAVPLMTAGDQVKVSIDLAAGVNDLEFRTRDHVAVVFMPEVGHQVVAKFDTPPDYGTKTSIELL